MNKGETNEGMLQLQRNNEIPDSLVMNRMHDELKEVDDFRKQQVNLGCLTKTIHSETDLTSATIDPLRVEQINGVWSNCGNVMKINELTGIPFEVILRFNKEMDAKGKNPSLDNFAAWLKPYAKEFFSN